MESASTLSTVTSRTSPLDPSEVVQASTNVTLICNTFSGWTTDISGAQQPPCNADLALTKVVSNATPNVGDQVTFTVTLTNNGPDTATNVQVTDLVPSGLTFVSATPSQGTYASATGLWTVGTVTTATPQTLQLLATIGSSAAQTNTAAISASDQPDPNIGNNTASASVAPHHDDTPPRRRRRQRCCRPPRRRQSAAAAESCRPLALAGWRPSSWSPCCWWGLA